MWKVWLSPNDLDGRLDESLEGAYCLRAERKPAALPQPWRILTRYGKLSNGWAVLGPRSWSAGDSIVAANGPSGLPSPSECGICFGLPAISEDLTSADADRYDDFGFSAV